MALFDQDNTPDLSAVTPEVALEELVGEGKKYATTGDLAKALLHAQAHIGKLESENGQYREQVSRAATIDEIMSKLSTQPAQQQPAASDQATPDAQPDLAKLVEQQFATLTKKQQEQANLDAFRTALVNAYGTEAAAKFSAAKAQCQGVDLEAIAAANPKVALQFFGIADTQPRGNSAPDLSRNASAPVGAVKEGTDLYFYNLRQAGKMTREQYYTARAQAIVSNPDLFYSQRAPKK